MALEAFSAKTGSNLYDYIDVGNFYTSEGNYPQIEFTWEEDQPKTLQKICPKLYEKMEEVWRNFELNKENF